MYDDAENDETERIESILQHKPARYTGLRSRFSNGEAELTRLAELGALMSRYAIKIESNTQDVNELWQFLGILNEFWESIRNVLGSNVQDEINTIKQNCRELLLESQDGTIPIKVHNNLLYYRTQLYKLRQSLNLSFEVEKIARGDYARAKKSIVQ